MNKVEDRLVQYPNRYELKDVNTGQVLGVFDLKAVLGSVQKEGTPINASLFESIATDIAISEDSAVSRANSHTNSAVNTAKQELNQEIQLKENRSALGLLAYKDSLTKEDVGLGNVNNTPDGEMNVNHANTADYASTAGYADEAGMASSATNATNADHATSADSATEAGTATSAGYADTASTATNALQLIGLTAKMNDKLNYQNEITLTGTIDGYVIHNITLSGKEGRDPNVAGNDIYGFSILGSNPFSVGQKVYYEGEEGYITSTTLLNRKISVPSGGLFASKSGSIIAVGVKKVVDVDAIIPPYNEYNKSLTDIDKIKNTVSALDIYKLKWSCSDNFTNGDSSDGLLVHHIQSSKIGSDFSIDNLANKKIQIKFDVRSNTTSAFPLDEIATVTCNFDFGKLGSGVSYFVINDSVCNITPMRTKHTDLPSSVYIGSSSSKFFMFDYIRIKTDYSHDSFYIELKNVKYVHIENDAVKITPIMWASNYIIYNLRISELVTL